MPVGKLPDFTEANDKPLQIDVRFWADRTKTSPVDIAAASAWLNEIGGDGYLAMTVVNGRVAIVDHVVQIRVPEEDMADLPGGFEGATIPYEFEVLVTDANGGAHEQRGRVEMRGPVAEPTP